MGVGRVEVVFFVRTGYFWNESRFHYDGMPHNYSCTWFRYESQASIYITDFDMTKIVFCSLLSA